MHNHHPNQRSCFDKIMYCWVLTLSREQRVIPLQGKGNDIVYLLLSFHCRVNLPSIQLPSSLTVFLINRKMKGNKVTFKYCKSFRPASAGLPYCFGLVPSFAQLKGLVWCIWMTLIIRYFTSAKHSCVTAAYMQDIRTVSGVMVAEYLWPSLTTSSPAVGTPDVWTEIHWASQRRGAFPCSNLQWTLPSCSPAQALQSHMCYMTKHMCYMTSKAPAWCMAGAALTRAQSSPPKEEWAWKLSEDVQGRWGNLGHSSRKGWTCSSFCLAGCHFTEPLAQRQSSLRQTRFSL